MLPNKYKNFPKDIKHYIDWLVENKDKDGFIDKRIDDLLNYKLYLKYCGNSDNQILDIVSNYNERIKFGNDFDIFTENAYFYDYLDIIKDLDELIAYLYSIYEIFICIQNAEKDENVGI